MTKKQLHQALGDREHDNHIDELTLASFIDNRLESDERQQVIEHLSQCQRCRTVLHKSVTSLQKSPQKERRFLKIAKALPIAASVTILFFATHHFWFQEEIIYKGGSHKITKLEVPTINKPKSVCSFVKQQEAKKYLEESYAIEDEGSLEYFQALSSSLKACYSPEVATKLYIIKANATQAQEVKIKLLKEALYHIAYSTRTPYRLSKEIEIFQKLKPYYKGIDKQDIINKIQIRQKELDAIAKNDD